jgi:hypothetical protein
MTGNCLMRMGFYFDSENVLELCRSSVRDCTECHQTFHFRIVNFVVYEFQFI